MQPIVTAARLLKTQIGRKPLAEERDKGANDKREDEDQMNRVQRQRAGGRQGLFRRASRAAQPRNRASERGRDRTVPSPNESGRSARRIDGAREMRFIVML